MILRLIKVENYQELSKQACDKVVEKITTLEKPILGLATGSTPTGLYQCLHEVYEKGEVSFTHTHTFNLDEYVGLAGENPNSYRYYMNEKLFKHIDIPLDQTYIPNGKANDLEKECQRYEQLLRSVEEIDIQILGLGLNGHIGFNEPGTSFNTDTHIVDLTTSTRKANARFFEGIESVPTQAITMGIRTIMQSNSILLLVSGEKKAEALNRLMNGEISEDFPASILQQHPNVTIIADRAALKYV